jgi:NAD(P)-dependent dehydrogenase (short-subunit alcohol dehydrogenase family)
MLLNFNSNREISTSEFGKMIDVDLKASFLLVKGAVERIKAQRWGRIIFVSSIAAYGAGINGCYKYFLMHPECQMFIRIVPSYTVRSIYVLTLIGPSHDPEPQQSHGVGRAALER